MQGTQRYVTAASSLLSVSDRISLVSVLSHLQTANGSLGYLYEERNERYRDKRQQNKTAT